MRSILLNGVVERGWARLVICTPLRVVDVDPEIPVRAALEGIFLSRIGNSGEGSNGGPETRCHVQLIRTVPRCIDHVGSLSERATSRRVPTTLASD